MGRGRGLAGVVAPPLAIARGIYTRLLAVIVIKSLETVLK